MKHNTSDPDHLDRLLNEREAADFLGYSMRALQNWRVRGGGPVFVKVSSRSVRYRRRDLIAWAESKLVSHTSQASTDSADEVASGRRPLTQTGTRDRRAPVSGAAGRRTVSRP